MHRFALSMKKPEKRKIFNRFHETLVWMVHIFSTVRQLEFVYLVIFHLLSESSTLTPTSITAAVMTVVGGVAVMVLILICYTRWVYCFLVTLV